MMKLFSQRKGLKPIKSIIQIDSMDMDLKNGLWNALNIYWDGDIKFLSDKKDLDILFRRLWNLYFKLPLDTLDNYFPKTYQDIRTQYFKWKYCEIYDFIEFIANYYPNEEINNFFMKICNEVLERELSAYRFVGGKITSITSEEEINVIESALKEAPNPINIHLNKSLELLSDRKSPDYRNSIKESISAIESICKLITKNPKGTLGRCLNTIENDVELHPALKEAFKKLYGYTSDAEGIRHALMDESNLDFEDAKFMLVSCTAFTNYLIAKAAKSDIEL